MKIVVASDHAGYPLKMEVVKHLEELGHDVIDVGTHSLDSCAYSEFGIKAGLKISNHEADCGIIMCGTGIGISIACNKVKGVRCALVQSEEFAKLTRMHNNANCIALPGRFMDKDLAIKIVDVYLNTPYEGGRHDARIKIISDFEETGKLK